ncbi:AraC family transcriptional regulator [Shewanella sp. D64]|uniref:helix-turn-helix transcriptional regulator n=1 Tax=unclassified Shewanella TaxID=196818 RepID=UPI0022BA249F|nr:MULTISPECIES: AraC family transcriptional regulator [unclassified Shewanella]MEC4728119.1 AraC family transcriptional regulator [Shewanella sp. D64]MEC4740239.1 AraC family transcriptional regulator [Shewanella sp. E94]WBJ94442.1 AraC family transcriptional regulator [Shewanella sp. MTB7]
MPTKIVSNTPKFVVFDLQKLSATQYMIFGADYVLIRPKTTGCTLHLTNVHYRLNIGQIVLLAPFNPFRLSLDTKSSYRNKTLDCDVLHFRLNGMGLTFIDSQQFAEVKSMLENARNGLLYEGEQITGIGKEFNFIENSFEFSQVLNILGILDKLSKQEPKQILLEDYIEINHVKKIEDKLNTCIRYIQEHLTEPLTVAMVAGQIYMGVSTFSRFFNANMGITFWQYVIEQRVRRSASLLVKTDNSISYICAEVGFTSISSYNTKFKELMKLTPKQYRINHMDMRSGIETSRIVATQINKCFLV